MFTIAAVTAKWAVAWGIVGALARLVSILVDPDTGHIPNYDVPLMIGVPSAAFGALAGLMFASLSYSVRRKNPTSANRALLGAAVAGAAGFAFMKVLAHSILVIPITALLGSVLGWWFAPRKAEKIENSI